MHRVNGGGWDTHHVVHVKDDRFIGHGLTLSRTGGQHLHTPGGKSQGHGAHRGGGQVSAGGTEGAHSRAGVRVEARKVSGIGEALPGRCHRAMSTGDASGSDPCRAARGAAADGAHAPAPRTQQLRGGEGGGRSRLQRGEGVHGIKHQHERLKHHIGGETAIHGGWEGPARVDAWSGRPAVIVGGGGTATGGPRPSSQGGCRSSPPGPWCLMTAVRGWRTGGGHQHQLLPRPTGAAAATAAGPHPASPSSSWAATLRDTSPQNTTRSMDEVSERSVGEVWWRSSSPALCASVPGSEPVCPRLRVSACGRTGAFDYIISASEATSSNSWWRLSCTEHITTHPALCQGGNRSEFTLCTSRSLN